MILFFPGAPDISDTLQPDQSVFIMMPLQMMYVFQRRITGQIFHFPYHVRLVGKTETGGTAGKICFLMQQNIPVDQIDQILKTDNSGKQFRSDCSFLRKDFLIYLSEYPDCSAICATDTVPPETIIRFCRKSNRFC